MSRFPKRFNKVINERSTADFFAVLKDPLGNLITLSDVDSIEATFFDTASGAIVNNRNSQNMLNANHATLDEFALFRWTLQPEDTTILDQQSSYETHRAEFVVLYNSGGGRLVFDVDFVIRNLVKEGT
ncbi:MAG: hypothetical protein NPIRA02_29580 [Nitrospirales bacterium]|nr:MAG: hypothetical protein NPIRA02_29580 [Nitrospirales bacterium]